MLQSPYLGKPEGDWPSITRSLIDNHPLDRNEIKEIVLQSWENIFESSIGEHRIGEDIFPSPQNIGGILHELVPAEIARRYPNEWRKETAKNDKDIVCISNDFYSIELKTSSNPNHIFGNRSYAQKPTDSKKGKDGYYLAINFEKFSKSQPKPKILKIRFGWLDHTDWIGQKAATGQQARLSSKVYRTKFESLF